MDCETVDTLGNGGEWADFTGSEKMENQWETLEVKMREIKKEIVNEDGDIYYRKDDVLYYSGKSLQKSHIPARLEKAGYKIDPYLPKGWLYLITKNCAVCSACAAPREIKFELKQPVKVVQNFRLKIEDCLV